MKTSAYLTKVSDDVLILNIMFELDQDKRSYIDFSLYDNVAEEVILELKHFLVEGKATFTHPIDAKDENSFTLSCDGGSDGKSDIEVTYEKAYYKFNKDLPRSCGFSVRPSNNPDLSRTLSVLVYGTPLAEGTELEDVVITYSDGSVETYEVKSGSSGKNAIIEKEFSYTDNLDFTIEVGTGWLYEVSMSKWGGIQYVGEELGEYSCIYFNYSNPEHPLHKLALIAYDTPTSDMFNVDKVGSIELHVDKGVKSIPGDVFSNLLSGLPSVKQFCSSPTSYWPLYNFPWSSNIAYYPMQVSLISIANNDIEVPSEIFKQFGALLCTEFMTISIECRGNGALILSDDIFDNVNTDVIDGTSYQSPLHISYLPQISFSYYGTGTVQRPISLFNNMKEKFGSFGVGEYMATGTSGRAPDTIGITLFQRLDTFPDIFDNISLSNLEGLFRGCTFEYVPDVLKGTKATQQNTDYKSTRWAEIDVGTNSYPVSYPLPTVLEYHTNATKMRMFKFLAENPNLKTVDMDMLTGVNIVEAHDSISTRPDDKNRDHYNAFRECTSLEGTVEDYVNNWYMKMNNPQLKISFLFGCTNLSDYATVSSDYQPYIDGTTIVEED